MKEKARILLAGFVFLLLVVVMPREALAATSGTFGDDITWELADGVLTFTGTGEMKNSQRSESQLPWYSSQKKIEKAVIGEGITSIGWGTFYGCSNLTEVVIPSTVKTINAYAFRNCYALTSVTIPAGVTEIWMYTFAGCSSLTSVVIPESVTTIGSDAFNGCSSLAFVKLPSALKRIDVRAFRSCSSLATIEFPGNLEYLYNEAFAYCTALTSVKIPENIVSMGSYVFWNCTSLTDVTFSDAQIPMLAEKDVFKGTPWQETLNINGYYIYKGYLMSVDEETVTGDITIPGSVQIIPEDMFRHNDEITSVTFSEGVTSIGRGAFGYCDNLVSVTFPKSLVSLGQDSFSWCEKLTTVNFGGGLQIVDNDENTYHARPFEETPWLTAELEANELVILDGRIVIDSKLTSSKVTIPEGVVQISETAFYTGGYLQEVKLPSTLKRIDRDAFANCYGFDVTIPASVETIGAEAFGYYVNSKISEKKYDITIYGTKGSAAEIYAKENDMTFVDVNTVKPEEPSTETPSTETPSTETPSTEKPSDTTGTTPAKGKKVDVDNATYKVTKAGSKNATVEYVAPKNTSATSITIPATVKVNGVTCKVTSVAANAFKGNKKLTKVVIGKNVTSIGANAFSGCTKLTTVTIGKNVKTIGKKAFYKCTALKKITIPAKVTKIGAQAFAGDKKLKTIVIKTTKLTKAKVGKNAFKGVYAKAAVKVPKAKKTAYKTILKARGITKVKIK